MESILTSIKSMLGIPEEHSFYDSPLITHINTVFMILSQIGVGPPEGFSIQDADTTWSDYVTEEMDLEGVKTYVFLQVRLLFDPPTHSSAVESAKNMIKELEWRLYTAADSTTS